MKKVLTAIGIVLGAALILAVVFIIAVMRFKADADQVGKEIGSGMGAAAGVAAGSFDGFTKGLSEGKEAGILEGLSAKDTTVDLGNEMRKTGKLNILEMDITITDENSVGANRILVVWKGTASYTVDFEQCSVANEGDSIRILVPRPVLRVTIDYEKTQKRAQANKNKYAGSSYDGYMAYINTGKRLSGDEVREKLVGYEALKQTAEDSARATIERLAGSVMVNKKPIVVEFTGIEEIVT